MSWQKYGIKVNRFCRYITLCEWRITCKWWSH